MGASEKFYLNIANQSKSKTLIFKNIHFDWGRETSPPIVKVPPKKTVQVLVAQGRDNTSSGTEGYITYEIEGLPGRWVKASWDVPWKSGATNTCSLSTSDDNTEEDTDGTILWENETSSTSSGTSLSVIVKFGFVIEL